MMKNQGINTWGALRFFILLKGALKIKKVQKHFSGVSSAIILYPIIQAFVLHSRFIDLKIIVQSYGTVCAQLILINDCDM